jgi:hypothetical protein
MHLSEQRRRRPQFAVSALRYEILRSVHDKSLHIIFPEGAFGVLLNIVRRLGPWRVLIGGNIIALTPRAHSCQRSMRWD